MQALDIGSPGGRGMATKLRDMGVSFLLKGNGKNTQAF